MRLAAGRIAEGDALHDETPGRGGPRGGDQVARALDADARIARIGGGELRLVEDAGQIGQLVDHDLGPRLHHGAFERVGIEYIDDDGMHARGFEFASGCHRARHAGDVMAGLAQ